MTLSEVLEKYEASDIGNYSSGISSLNYVLKKWAGMSFIDILYSGSRAKGTAISISSDLDIIISLTHDSNNLKENFESLYKQLKSANFVSVKKQNISIRVSLRADGLFGTLLPHLEVDITPARKHWGNTNDHSIWVSKSNSWQKTNIQVHINDISRSGRTDEIKLLKIWREKNRLDFPSIYLEYLLINKILHGKPSGNNNLNSNFSHVIHELAKGIENPLTLPIRDPANSNNILSNLLNGIEKGKIIYAAKIAVNKANWNDIFQLT